MKLLIFAFRGKHRARSQFGWRSRGGGQVLCVRVLVYVFLIVIKLDFFFKSSLVFIFLYNFFFQTKKGEFVSKNVLCQIYNFNTRNKQEMHALLMNIYFNE